ncbi:MAG TPA: prepilin-type N-terminal cleavage/methylation domain-containing protein [Methylomirabilota bacterium]|jgi:type IV pilus assembly protein PilW|nr:prepilin-type N-terminal cleavage/methylation domain-containing protein [Methylomirabilota bacterium]
MSDRGYTLVELLVGLAVGSVVLAGVSGFYMSSLRFSAETNSQVALQRQGTLILEEMARQIRPAARVTITTCSQVAGALQVTNKDASGADQTVCFRPTATQLYEDRPNGSANLLAASPSPLTVTAFTASVSNEAATVTFELRDQLHNSMTFTTTLFKRN